VRKRGKKRLVHKECVSERERQRWREKERETGRQRETEGEKARKKASETKETLDCCSMEIVRTRVAERERQRDREIGRI